MASYIPASYAGRNFATRPAAHDQLWSNDDCLSSAFITDGKKGMKKYEDDLRAVRPDKPPLSEEVILAKIAEHKKKRKDAVKRSKANKAARAAAGQGGAHLQSKAIRDKKLELTNVDERFAQLKKEKVFKGQAITKQEEDEYTATKQLLEIQLRKLEIKDEPYAGQGGNASGKKKKKKSNKIALSAENKTAFEQIVSDHAGNVIDALDQAETHADYSQKLKKEFQRFSKDKVRFYDKLPTVTDKELNAKERRIKHVQDVASKYQAKNVDEGQWNPTNFADFKILMNEYRTKLQQINVDLMPSVQKSNVKKSLRSKRTLLVQDLLNGKRYELGAFEVMNMERV